MAPCHGASCAYGAQTVTNPELGELSGSYRVFVEVVSFIIFGVGVTLNTGILTVLISAYPNIDHFDGYLMSLTFGELVSSFSLAFVFFVEFTTTLAPIGDGGCSFLTWLDVTSVTITITALIIATYELHHRIYYNASATTNRRGFIFNVIITWLVASLPGLPYLGTAKMGEDNFCYISHWSHDAEILYICALLLFQVIVPLAILVFFFVRIFIALRAPHDGDAISADKNNPGSEATFQRALLKRKVAVVFFVAVLFFMVLIIVSFVELSLALNVNNVEDNPRKYARIREANALMECLKCLFVPIVFMIYYDKLKNQFRNLCCCRRNQDVYNTLSLRYSVYQQTVQDTHTENDHRESRDMEVYETERDDVAILDNAS